WRALERERQNSYFQRIALAEREWSANNLGRMEQLLEECPADLRGWEWRYLKRRSLEGLASLPHQKAVFSAVFSPDDRWIASGSQDGSVTIWQASTGKKQLKFQAHEKHVRCVTFSPDGRRLATASWDRTAKVWDVDTLREGDNNKPLRTLDKHRAPVSSVAFSPDGHHLASAGDDKIVRVWDAATGDEICTFPGHATGRDALVLPGTTTGLPCVAYSPDGRFIALANGDTTLKIWDATTGQEVQTLRGHRAQVFGVTFSRDGKQLASAASDMNTRTDGEIK